MFTRFNHNLNRSWANYTQRGEMQEQSRLIQLETICVDKNSSRPNM